MTKQRAASVTAAVGAGLVFATAGLHFSAYSFILAQIATDARPLVAALWVFCGLGLIFSALLAIAAAPVFIVRRRALLWIAALTPASIAVLQIVYLGFMSPTAFLLLDTVILVVAGELGRAYQPRPVVTA